MSHRIHVLCFSLKAKNLHFNCKHYLYFVATSKSLFSFSLKNIDNNLSTQLSFFLLIGLWICAVQNKREIRMYSLKQGKPEPFTKKILLKGSW